MRDFFKGWRRKVGCVTLMMACVFMAGWMRSTSVVDEFSFLDRTKYDVYCDSSRGCIGWVFINDKRRPSNTSLWNKLRSMIWMTNPNPIDVFNGAEWQFRRAGFGSGKYFYDVNTPFDGTVITVPYWSIVVPLALVSANLLLSESRQSIPKKSLEPCVAEGVNRG
jgi:hypothetical protein